MSFPSLARPAPVRAPRAVAMTVLAALACGPAPRVLERELSPADAVIAISDADHPRDAVVTIAFADGRGRVDLALDAPEVDLAVAIVRAVDVVSPDGGPVSLTELRVDVRGDTSDGCGCSATAIELPQRVGPGDRCALPAKIAIEPVNGTLEPTIDAELRARLRLTWPGVCAAPLSPALVARSEVLVCPLGVGIRRMEPSRTALAPDGATVAVTRGRTLEMAPSGALHEVTIEPAATRLVDALSVGAAGTLITTSTDNLTPLASVPAELLWVPARGAGPGVRLQSTPINFRPYGSLRASSPASVWLFGSVLETLSSRAAVFRCALRGGTSLSCTGGSLDASAVCPAFGRRPVTGMAHLEGGDVVGLDADARLFLLREGTPSCLAEARDAPIRALSGDPIIVGSTDRLLGLGRRVTACVVGTVNDAQVAVIATATVGAWTSGPPIVRWETVAEQRSPSAFCAFGAYVDPRVPDRAVTAFGDRDGQRAVSVARTSTRVEARLLALDDRFPELDGGFHIVATTTTGIAVTTDTGETWAASLGDRVLRRRVALDPPGYVKSSGVVATAEGFRVAGGGGYAVTVRVPPGDGCEGIAVDAPREAYVNDDEVRDRVLVPFGDRVLTLGVRGGVQQLRVDGEAPVLLDGDAHAVSGAEIITGRWAAWVRSDGTLWATDGVRVARLDDGGAAEWRSISAAGGIGWVASVDELARLLPARGGEGLILERDVLAQVDRRSFDAVARNAPPEIVAVRGWPSGSATLAFREQLSNRVQGSISDASVWWLRPEHGQLTLSRYEALIDRGPRPLHPQVVSAITGREAAPLLIFGGSEQSAGLHAPGAPVTALPLGELSAVADRDGDTLVLARGLRMVVVRVR